MTVARDLPLTPLRVTMPAPRTATRTHRPSRLMALAWATTIAMMTATYVVLMWAIQVLGR